MFRRYKGKTKWNWLQVTVSTTFSLGGMVSFSSGELIEATSSTTALSHPGIIRHAIASTDSDYATARLVEVEMPLERFVEWRGDVTSGLVAGDIGLEVDFTDNLTINRAASSINIAIVRDVLSSTEGIFWFSILGSY